MPADRSYWATALIAIAIALSPISATARVPLSPAHLTSLKGTAPPPGAVGLCSRLPWACDSRGTGRRYSDQALFSLAHTINRRVNREIGGQSDLKTYGVVEWWALPVNGKGDCEDYALLKMKRLIEAGVPASTLALAVVVGPMPDVHVVLVMRTARGDLVLDNRTSRIKPWSATGYTFLKMQRPGNRAKWDIVAQAPKARALRLQATASRAR
ncbi:MAG TPA: transglutaminase-like cysteine peptidase [Afifellaceae bacterium]|nr:transglutaminase-like cysteine peptidase [Afifellaceae bacterium]